MKKMFLLTGATRANSTNIVFQNTGGRITLHNHELSLRNSTLTSFSGPGGTTIKESNLGGVCFTTGKFTSGNIGVSAPGTLG